MSIGMFRVTESSGKKWWYDKFIGVEFLGEIEWDNHYFELSGVKRIKQVIAIAMVKNVYINHGRSLSPEHIMLL